VAVIIQMNADYDIVCAHIIFT